MVQAFDVIVIGGGLGGLTAGAMAATAGQRVLLVEKNAHVGGAATTYARAGRRFEASLHETTDPHAGADPKGRIFDALDLNDKVSFVPIPAFQQVRAPHLGLHLTLPTGLAALEKALSARFPDDARAIARFLRQVRRSQDAIALFMERHDGAWWWGHASDVPLDLWALVRDIGSSLSDVFTRYFGVNEALKIALAPNLPYYTDDPDTFWWMAYAVAQGGFLTHGRVYIRGGSGALSQALAETITEHGGEIRCGCAVTEILLDDADAVRGVRLADGSTPAAPLVFGNAAPHALARMLPMEVGGPFRDSFADRPLSISLFEASFALDRPGRELGLDAYSTVLIPDWMELLDDYRAAGRMMGSDPAGRMPPMIVVDYSQIDSGLGRPDAPPPITVTGIDRLENWESLSPEAYAARKAAWLGAITARLETEWPGFAKAVQVSDLATARTMHQTLGTPGGALYGFAPRPPHLSQPGPKHQVSAKTMVPGLWLAGAYAGFGGFTGAMGSGAMAAMQALRPRG